MFRFLFEVATGGQSTFTFGLHTNSKFMKVGFKLHCKWK